MYDRLIADLDAAGARYRLIEHAPEGRTDLVSALRGHDITQAAKCLIVMVKIGKKQTRYVLAVVPGPPASTRAGDVLQRRPARPLDRAGHRGLHAPGRAPRRADHRRRRVARAHSIETAKGMETANPAETSGNAGAIRFRDARRVDVMAIIALLADEEIGANPRNRLIVAEARRGGCGLVQLTSDTGRQIQLDRPDRMDS